MPNYASLLATAQRLIAGAGRSMTIIVPSTTPKDATKPWRGTDTTLDASYTVIGVFVDNGTVSALADGSEVQRDAVGLVRRGGRGILVADSGVDYKQARSVVDGTKTWQVVQAVQVKPGDTSILWALEVED